MRQRCLNPNNKEFKNYGARGIQVCERWGDFRAFFEDTGEVPAGKTLDRIDNDKGYEPSNCRWATRAEQLRNQRRTHLIEAWGRTQCIGDWASEFGVAPGTIRYRLRKGLSPEKAISTPAMNGYTLEAAA